MSTKVISDSCSWLVLCAQIYEALSYLHDDTNIIHNDINCVNLLTPYMPCTAASSSTKEQVCEYQIVLIDFGKATDKDNSKKYNLLFSEKLPSPLSPYCS